MQRLAGLVYQQNRWIPVVVVDQPWVCWRFVVVTLTAWVVLRVTGIASHTVASHPGGHGLEILFRQPWQHDTGLCAEAVQVNKELPLLHAHPRSGEHGGADSPGPGAYNARRVDFESAAAFTMRGGRRSSVEQAGDDSPGPGAYDVAAYAASASAPAWTMPGAARARAGEGEPGADSPGPGVYAPPQQRVGPAYTIAGRPTDRSDAGARERGLL